MNTSNAEDDCDERLTLKGYFKVISLPPVKSKYKFWQDLNVGDIVEVSQVVYESYMRQHLTLRNVNSGESFTESMNKVMDYLNKFDFKPLKDYSVNSA